MVYTNGPINGSINAINVGANNEVTDSFAITGPLDLAAAGVGLWSTDGSMPQDISWSIGTTPYGSDVSSGSSVLSDSLSSIAGFNTFPIYEATFAISGAVTTGTYYLTLSNSTPSAYGWDENNGPSLAFMNGSNPIGSEAFRLFDSAAPDATSTLGLLAIGLGAAFVAARREREFAR